MNQVLHGVAGFFALLLEGVSGVARGLFLVPFRVKFALIHLVLALTLLFNAEAIYGAGAVQQTTMLLLYLVSIVFAFVSTGRPNPLVRISTAEFLVVFATWGVVGFALFKALSPYSPPSAELTTASVGILLTHAFVVAVGEELLFRYAIPSMIPGPAIVAQAVSAIAFGAMHWTAYDGNLGALAWATFLGLVFGTVAVMFPRNGLIVSIALHFAWNASVLGYT